MACSSFAAEEKSVPEAEGGSAWPQPARDRASAAAEKQQENTPTTHGEPHSHKSWIMAAMLPRRSPITR